MNRAQLIGWMHYLVKGNKKANTLVPYETCSAEQGYQWANKYLLWVAEESNKSKNQQTYWMWEGDRIFARILCTCFRYYTQHGFDWPDMPKVPDLGSYSPQGKLFILEQWANKLQEAADRSLVS